jgi:hypothetical protein
VAARRSEGGTGFAQVREQLRLARQRLGSGIGPDGPSGLAS